MSTSRACFIIYIIILVIVSICNPHSQWGMWHALIRNLSFSAGISLWFWIGIFLFW